VISYIYYLKIELLDLVYIQVIFSYLGDYYQILLTVLLICL